MIICRLRSQYNNIIVQCSVALCPDLDVETPFLGAGLEETRLTIRQPIEIQRRIIVLPIILICRLRCQSINIVQCPGALCPDLQKRRFFALAQRNTGSGYEFDNQIRQPIEIQQRILIVLPIMLIYGLRYQSSIVQCPVVLFSCPINLLFSKQ